jgi:hypothetical protein
VSEIDRGKLLFEDVITQRKRFHDERKIAIIDPLAEDRLRARQIAPVSLLQIPLVSFTNKLC